MDASLGWIRLLLNFDRNAHGYYFRHLKRLNAMKLLQCPLKTKPLPSNERVDPEHEWAVALYRIMY